VTPNSPAAKAGLQRGDIVLELDGQTINGPDDLSVRSMAHMKIVRNGQTQDTNVTLGEFPENSEAAAKPNNQPEAPALAGVQVQNLTPDLAQQIGVPPSTQGVVVTAVDPSGAAATAGIQVGDVIQQVNRKPVHNTTEFEQALRGTSNQPVLLLVNRKGTTHFALIQPEQGNQ
jgi:serine protease Do